MSIAYRVLGPPGADNALFATVEDGQSRSRLLFDCGQGVLDDVSFSEIAKIEALFFSHFHFDHFAGFDSVFRRNWCRPDSPVRIFGPTGTCQVMHHRLQGFIWNNAVGQPGEFLVSEFDGRSLRTIRLRTTDCFRDAVVVADVDSGGEPGTGILYETERFTVSCCVMDHGTDSLAFITREKPSINVDALAMESLGLRGGPWIRSLKKHALDACDETMLEVEGRSLRIGELRDRLLKFQEGGSIAYLTDFTLANSEDEEKLLRFLEGCKVLICENNYLDAEVEQARRNRHLTTSEVGRLARSVAPDMLVLFHLSDRYLPEQWALQLDTIRKLYPATVFPEHYRIDELLADGIHAKG